MIHELINQQITCYISFTHWVIWFVEFIYLGYLSFTWWKGSTWNIQGKGRSHFKWKKNKPKMSSVAMPLLETSNRLERD